MAQTNQDIAYNNSLAVVEAALATITTNTQQDWSSISSQVCDVLGGGGSVPIMMIEHFRSGVLQSTEYRTLLGAPYTIAGTLGNCDSVAAPNYTSLLTAIGTNTSATNTNVGNVVTSVNSSNSTLSSIDTGIAAINSKLGQTCAGSPIKVTVCNPAIADFTSTNALLTTGNSNTGNINTGIGDVNTKLTSTNTKIDTTNTTLSSISAKLNESCAGTPLNVFVCNQPSTTVDFTSTNAILTSIDGKSSNIVTNTGNISTGVTSTNTKLDTVNTNLTSIYGKLNASCVGTPINVNVCNQIDLTTTQTSLASIDTKLTTTNSNLGTIVTNTGNTKTSVDTVNTNITSLKTQLTATNTNHVVVDNLPSVSGPYDKNEIITIGSVGATSQTYITNLYHSLRIQVVVGIASINQGGFTFTAPTGFELYMEATTLLINPIVVTCTISDLVVMTTMRV